MAKTADFVVKAQVLPVDAVGVAAGAGWNVCLGCAPWKGGTFPVGERPTRRTRSRRKQPEQSWNTKYLEVAYTELRRQGNHQRRPVAACRTARLGAHRADRRLRLEHCRSTAGRYAQTAAAAAISTGGLSSLNVPDVVHSEHFRVVTPKTLASGAGVLYEPV